MQFATETNETPLFTVKAVTGTCVNNATARALLSAALLRRPGPDGAILDGNGPLAGRGVSASSGPSVIQWMASRRLHDRTPPLQDRMSFGRLGSEGLPADGSRASKRRRLEVCLRELVHTLSDEDLALAVGHMRLLLRARRRRRGAS
jgi:hypothetical protein